MREIQSLARGLHVLDLLVNTRRPHTVTEIAAFLDVDKSSASRLLGTLEQYGYIQQEPDSRAYTVGKRLVTISWQLTNRYALRETARPYLDHLAEVTGECAHIGVYSAGKALVTDDVQSETSLLRVVGSAGRLIHLHNTAVGKGLIAHGDFPLPDHLPEITPRTLTTLDALQADLETVRSVGYAYDDEENESGVRCIAAPVFDAAGVAVAALGISGPTVRVTDNKVAELGRMVREAAHRLSCELGYQG